jgi:DNA-binding response OmpR family regulator
MDCSTLHEQPTVLLVEDDPALASQYADWLEPGCTVLEAEDREAAFGAFEAGVDVAVLDRGFDDGSGDELLACIREMGLDWKVALLSDAEPTLDALELSFDAYLCRPLEAAALLDTIERLVLHADIGTYLEEFYSLSRRKRAVDRHVNRDELAADENYARLERRLEELYRLLERSRAVVGDASGVTNHS